MRGSADEGTGPEPAAAARGGYVDTFIRVADDCPAASGEVPAPRATPTVAELQHRLLTEHPYAFTEEQLYVRVHGLRQGLDEADIAARYDALRAELYATPQACLRASPLTKRYGWGAHYDGEGRIGLHPLGGVAYRRLASDAAIAQLPAMRSSRRR